MAKESLPFGMSPGYLKAVACAALIVQSTSLVLLTRYSRVRGGTMYLTSTVVICGEFVKIFACLLYKLVETRGGFFGVIREARQESLKVAPVAFLYAIQNNLLFYALANLSAILYQVLYQLKILTTAVFFVLIMRRSLSWAKWISLGLLTVGVTLANVAQITEKSSLLRKEKDNNLGGIVAVLAACVSSGFAGVYLEKVLKTTKQDIWIRNIQLGTFGGFLALSGALYYETEIWAHGFFVGYDIVTWMIILLHAVGGLVIAAIVKYADNVVKTLAASFTIITSAVLSLLMFGITLGPTFWLSVAFVCFALWLYNSPDPTCALDLLSKKKPEVSQLDNPV